MSLTDLYPLKGLNISIQEKAQVDVSIVGKRLLTRNFSLCCIDWNSLHVDGVCRKLRHMKGILSKHGLDVLDDAHFESGALLLLLLL